MTTAPAPAHVRVRTLAEGDWTAVLALEAAAHGAHDLSESPEALRSRARHAPDTCLVLTTPDAERTDGTETVLGYLLALPYPEGRHPDLTRPETTPHPDADNLHLHDIVVAAPARGRRLADLLLHELVDRARTRGHRTVSLVAVSGTAPYWTARGFTPRPADPAPTGYGPDAVPMTRPLHPHPEAS
ncbi:GNAT family N-acetyltransferase (plasmid) [Streptomyces sp. BI20]|uniref:GNAT family N-acetyltransferase n=1 Tax=Streptomyces sp. BI20 TaxID=3403460 RepID=UPI003C755ACB